VSAFGVYANRRAGMRCVNKISSPIQPSFICGSVSGYAAACREGRPVTTFEPGQVQNLRQRLADACRILGVLGLASGNTGHLSVRVPDSDNLLIRARGPAESGVRYTAPTDIIEVTPDGEVAGGVKDGLFPPQEVFIHTEVYRARKDVVSVVHVHPPTVVLFTIADVPLLPIFGAYDPSALKIATDGIPTYDRAVLISNPHLGHDLAAALGDKNVCMMRGHGITATGSSIEEAALRAISLNELAEMNYRVRQIGAARPISDEDIATFSAPPGTPAKPISSNRTEAMWRYYQRLTGIVDG
jgi:3,4-dihydroxyphthalate decarboxylase